MVIEGQLCVWLWRPPACSKVDVWGSAAVVWVSCLVVVVLKGQLYAATSKALKAARS